MACGPRMNDSPARCVLFSVVYFSCVWCVLWFLNLHAAHSCQFVKFVVNSHRQSFSVCPVFSVDSLYAGSTARSAFLSIWCILWFPSIDSPFPCGPCFRWTLFFFFHHFVSIKSPNCHPTVNFTVNGKSLIEKRLFIIFGPTVKK